MAKIAVNLKIDLSKIDESKVFNGAKGRYLDATVFIDVDQADQYGNNGMITQSVKKEDKDAGVKGNILGNCKVFWRENSSAPAAPAAPAQPAAQPQPGAYRPPFAAQQAPQNAPVPNIPPADDFDADIPF